MGTVTEKGKEDTILKNQEKTQNKEHAEKMLIARKGKAHVLRRKDLLKMEDFKIQAKDGIMKQDSQYRGRWNSNRWKGLKQMEKH
jgi:hypothetical protein